MNLYDDSYLNELVKDNTECWNINYWEVNIRDEGHYKIWENAVHKPDYKLLYDSYIWKRVLTPYLNNTKNNIMELLPGTSLTIPLALESSGFNGTLCRLDNFTTSNLTGLFSFQVVNSKLNFFDTEVKLSSFDLILGNHIIDDLIMFLHLPDYKMIYEIYDNPELSEFYWSEINREENQSRYQNIVITAFRSLVNSMKKNARLILRQYPSTFALKNKDFNRIRMVQNCFSMLVSELNNGVYSKAVYIDTKSISCPNGSNIKHSFVEIIRL